MHLSCVVPKGHTFLPWSAAVSQSLAETTTSPRGQWYYLEVMVSWRACGQVAQRKIACAGGSDAWGEATGLEQSHKTPQVQAVKPKSSSRPSLSDQAPLSLLALKMGTVALALRHVHICTEAKTPSHPREGGWQKVSLCTNCYMLLEPRGPTHLDLPTLKTPERGRPSRHSCLRSFKVLLWHPQFSRAPVSKPWSPLQSRAATPVGNSHAWPSALGGQRQQVGTACSSTHRADGTGPGELEPQGDG